jgi:RNA polymerase sigma factor (sigma-70 family)
MTAPDIHRTISAVWRIESPRLVAALARITRDVGLAEDLAQDALVKALEEWPKSGIPDRPGAWLMTAAKRRAIDLKRHYEMSETKHEIIGRQADENNLSGPDYDTALDDDIGDDLLRLMFTSCHPALAPESRTALTLRLLGGLTTDEIARAFLSSESTIAQRIVRAKRTIAEKKIPYEVPRGMELGARLASVLEVIYLIFNEGYTATAGDDWLRPALCEDALRLGRVLCGLMPDEAEVHGLLALMEIQASRSGARTNASGEPVLLLDQDRSRWDRMAIQRGLASLERAQSLREVRGVYTAQAAIAACHARALVPEETDWPRISRLYDELFLIMPTPVVELNRAVAVGMAFGPTQGLKAVDAIVAEGNLTGYHLLHAARADMLEKLGRRVEARAEFERAASLTQNQREQSLLLKRAAQNSPS